MSYKQVSLWSFTLGFALQAILNAIQLGNRIIRNPGQLRLTVCSKMIYLFVYLFNEWAELFIFIG